MKRNDEKNFTKEYAAKKFFYHRGEIYSTYRGRPQELTDRTDIDPKYKPISATKVVSGNEYRVASVRIGGHKFMLLAHNVVWNLHKGKIPDNVRIRHRDRNTLNNSIDNLLAQVIPQK